MEDKPSVPFKAIPQTDETTGSVLLRAAELHSHNSIYSFARKIIEDSGKIFNLHKLIASPEFYQQDLDTLGVVLNESRIIADPYHGRWSLTCTYNNKKIDARILRRDLQHFCPACLRDSAHWRTLWTMKLYEVCHIHGIKIISKCGNCGKLPSLRRGNILFCKSCGFDFRKSKTTNSDRIATSQLVKFLEFGSQAEVDLYIETWSALKKCFPTINDDYHVKLSIATAFFFKKRTLAHSTIIELYKVTQDRFAPELQFLPLKVTKTPALSTFACDLILDCHDLDISYNENSEVLLSRAQTLSALDISASKLRFLIEREAIVPDSQSTHILKFKSRDVMNITRNPNFYRDIYLSSRDFKKEIDSCNILEAAKFLDMHPGTIRNLIKANFIEADKIYGPSKAVCHQMSKDNLQKYNSVYITLTTFGKEKQIDPRYLVGRLRALGAEPVFRQPNGQLTVFTRASLANITKKGLEKIKRPQDHFIYPSKTLLTNKITNESTSYASIDEACARLDMNWQQLINIIKRGNLDICLNPRHPVLVTCNSLEKLAAEFERKDILSIEEAAIKIGCDKRYILKYFVGCGLLDLIVVDIRKFVLKHQLDSLLSLLKTFTYTKEFCQRTGAPSYYLLQLRRLKPLETIVFRKTISLTLYKISDLEIYTINFIKNRDKTSISVPTTS